jgi:hypothetical protein
MNYVIDKLSDLEIIKITVSGTLNQDIRKEIHSKAVSELNTNDYHRLLIDVTASKVSKNYKINDTLDLIKYMNSLEAKNHTKTAFLSTQTETAHDNFVKLSQVVGGKYIKHFSNYDEAINWLLEGKDIFT